MKQVMLIDMLFVVKHHYTICKSDDPTLSAGAGIHRMALISDDTRTWYDIRWQMEKLFRQSYQHIIKAFDLKIFYILRIQESQGDRFRRMSQLQRFGCDYGNRTTSMMTDCQCRRTRWRFDDDHLLGWRKAAMSCKATTTATTTGSLS